MLRYTLDDHSELRLLQLHHADALFDLTDRNRERLRQWLPWVNGVGQVEDTRAFIKSRLEALAKGTGYDLTIWHHGKIAGTLGLFDLHHDGIKGEIGYWLGQEFVGKGLMTRSVKALLAFAFEELELYRVQIKVHPDNIKSRAIPERLGFSLEGTLRSDGMLYGKPVDHVLYSLTNEDWAK